MGFPAPIYICLNNFLPLSKCLDTFVKSQLRRKRTGALLGKKSIDNVSMGYPGYILLDLIYFVMIFAYAFMRNIGVNTVLVINIFIKLWYQGFADLTKSVGRCSFLSFPTGCVC